MINMQVWKLRPWVQQLVSQHLEELAALKRPTIGFHIRGGDLLFADKYLVGLSCHLLGTLKLLS
jgi:hypothetical protein